MKIIQHHRGNQEAVWASARESLRSGPILAEAGESRTCTKLIPVRTGWELWIHAVHSGDTAKFLIALSNDATGGAVAVVMQGAGWEIGSIIEAAAGSTCEMFPDSNFREKRSIVMDIGKAAYKVLGELNQKVMSPMETEELSGCLVIDPYQPLLDVEWIEDRMEGIGTYYL